MRVVFYVGFFFQAEDGIRDVAVTGVQTCALPIYYGPRRRQVAQWFSSSDANTTGGRRQLPISRRCQKILPRDHQVSIPPGQRNRIERQAERQSRVAEYAEPAVS